MEPKPAPEPKKFLTVDQILLQPDGAVLDGAQGKLLEAGPVETKNRPSGEAYTMQEFSLGEWGNAIRGIIYDHKSLDEYVGKLVVIMSVKSRNGRYGGVTVHKEQSGGSLFVRKPLRSALRVSRVGAVYRIEDAIK